MSQNNSQRHALGTEAKGTLLLQDLAFASVCQVCNSWRKVHKVKSR